MAGGTRPTCLKKKASAPGRMTPPPWAKASFPPLGRAAAISIRLTVVAIQSHFQALTALMGFALTRASLVIVFQTGDIALQDLVPGRVLFTGWAQRMCPPGLAICDKLS